MNLTLTALDGKQTAHADIAYAVITVGAETYYLSAGPNDGLLLEVKHTEADQRPLATEQAGSEWQIWRVKE